MNIAERLKEYLQKRNIAVTQFADSCEVPRPTMSQLLNGRSKKVSDELIRKIHTSYPELSMLWLMFGEGPMLAQTQSPPPSTPPPSRDNDDVEVGHDDVPSIDFDFVDQLTSTLRESEESAAMDMLDAGRDKASGADGHDKPMEAGDRMSFVDQDEMQGHESANIKFENVDSDMQMVQDVSVSDTQRRIVSIIVYYSDNSYESFGPIPHSGQ